MPRVASSVIVASFLMLPAVAEADTVARATVADARLLGAATMRFVGIQLYDARLYTPGGAAFDWAAPMALQLDYKRNFSRAELTAATVREMRRMEGARPDHSSIGQMVDACFRDVGPGDQFVAVGSSDDEVSLWFNGTRTCTLAHAGIKQRFMGIWLSERSRSPHQSQRLRGE